MHPRCVVPLRYPAGGNCQCSVLLYLLHHEACWPQHAKDSLILNHDLACKVIRITSRHTSYCTASPFFQLLPLPTTYSLLSSLRFQFCPQEIRGHLQYHCRAPAVYPPFIPEGSLSAQTQSSSAPRNAGPTSARPALGFPAHRCHRDPTHKLPTPSLGRIPRLQRQRVPQARTRNERY